MAAFTLKVQTNILRLAFVGLTVLLVWGTVRQAEAGCQRFGHSCFGAHGKRAEIPSSPSGGMEFEGIGNYNSRPNEFKSLPRNYNDNRISPYLIDWIMSMRRGEPKESLEIQPRDDIEVRRK